jgi:hypothetical protein
VDKPTWSSVFKDPAMIVTLIVTWQFFSLIIWFSLRPNTMSTDAKGIILQTYVVAFTACWSYFLRGAVDKVLAERAAKITDAPLEPTAHVIQQP